MYGSNYRWTHSSGRELPYHHRRYDMSLSVNCQWVELVHMISDIFFASLRGAKRLRGEAEANSTRFLAYARNRLRNLQRLPRPDKSGLAMAQRITIQCYKHMRCHPSMRTRSWVEQGSGLPVFLAWGCAIRVNDKILSSSASRQGGSVY